MIEQKDHRLRVLVPFEKSTEYAQCVCLIAFCKGHQHTQSRNSHALICNQSMRGLKIFKNLIIISLYHFHR